MFSYHFQKPTEKKNSVDNRMHRKYIYICRKRSKSGESDDWDLRTGRRFPIGNRSHFAVPGKRRRKSIERKKNALVGGRRAVAVTAMEE